MKLFISRRPRGFQYRSAYGRKRGMVFRGEKKQRKESNMLSLVVLLVLLLLLWFYF